MPPWTTTTIGGFGDGSVPLVEGGEVEAQWSGGVDEVGDPAAIGRQSVGIDDPSTQRGRRVFAGQQGEVVDVDPAPLGDDPCDGTIGPGP